MAIALVIVGILVFFAVPWVGIVVGVVGIVLAIAWFAGFGGRAARAERPHQTQPPR